MERHQYDQMGQPKDPYTARSILFWGSAPIWLPAGVALYLLAVTFALAFTLLCTVLGSILVLLGTTLEIIRVESAGLKMRIAGSKTIDFGIETLKEIMP